MKTFFYRRLKRSSSTDPGLLDPKTWNELLDYVESLEKLIIRNAPASSQDIGVRETSQGITFWLKRRMAGGTFESFCPFGEIIRWKVDGLPKVGIRGGLITCGEDSWNIPDQEIDLEVTGSWLVSISVAVVANRDDDDSVLLPGIESATAPTTWDNTTYTGTEHYPDGSSPTIPTGHGTIVLPLGILTIAEGKATYVPTGCGSFHITHCAGSLTYYRAATLE